MRFAEMNLKKKQRLKISDYEKKTKYIEYPEEMNLGPKPFSVEMEEAFNDPNIRDKFFEGVTYEKDPQNSEE